MSRTLWMVAFIAAAGAGHAYADDTWHVDITQHETITVTEAAPKDPANTKLDRKTTSQLQLSSTDAASAGGGAVAIAPAKPRLELAVGDYKELESTSSKTPYRAGDARSDIDAHLQRDTVTYSFTYRDDAHWSLEAQVSFSGKAKAHSCDHDLVMHEDNCSDQVDDTVVSAGVSAGPQTATLAKVKGGFSIRWSHDDRTTDAATGHQEVHHVDGTATITRRGGDQKYEAVLMPALAGAYQRWVPKGPPVDGKDPDAAGATVEVRLEIRDHKTHKPVNVGYSATYTLDSSRWPGYAMNAPKNAPSTKPDLFFDPAKNAGHVVHDERNLIAAHGTGVDTVVVSSRDYGATGTISASIDFDDGASSVVTTYEGVDLKGKKVARDAPMHIPLDENHNDIADSWEDKAHVYDKKLPANDDTEHAPDPAMSSKGDGYTLFEEYRGFVTEAFDAKGASSLVHTQLDPVRQDLLVSAYDEEHRDDLLAAATLFGAITGFKIRTIKGADHLAWRDGDMEVYATIKMRTMPRWANFNGVPDDRTHFGPKQVAMRVFTANVNTGNSAPNNGGDGSIDTPQGQRPFIGAPIDFVGAAVSWSTCDDNIAIWTRHLTDGTEPRVTKGLAATHLDGATIAAAAKDPKKRLLLAKRFFRFAVMHEMGHNVGVLHHRLQAYFDAKIPEGASKTWAEEEFYSKDETHCPMRYWQYADVGTEIVQLMAGTWDPSAASYWHFCAINVPEMHLHD